MDDLATLTAAPRTRMIGGRRYDFHQLTIGDLGKLEAWAQSQFPDPIGLVLEAIGKNEHLSIGQSKHLMTAAVEVAARPKPRMGSPELDAVIRSAQGAAEMLFLSVSKGDPTFTRKDAAQLYEIITMADLEAIFKDTGVKAALGDPKAETNGAAQNPSSRNGGNSTIEPAKSFPGEAPRQSAG